MSSGTYGKQSVPTRPRVPAATDTKRGHEEPTEVPCPTCARSGVCQTCKGRRSVPTDVAAGIEDERKRQDRCTCK